MEFGEQRGIGMTGGRNLALSLVVLAAASCAGADDWTRGIGQTLYNSGKYVCTQSSNCDSGGDTPGSASNRR